MKVVACVAIAVLVTLGFTMSSAGTAIWFFVAAGAVGLVGALNYWFE